MQVIEYIGKKYEPGARGPTSFDCWGLVMFYYQDTFGIELPNQPTLPEDIPGVIKAFQKGQTCGDWIPTEDLKKGTVVAFGRNKFISHAGVHIDNRLVMHVTRQSKKVVVQSIDQIKREFSLVLFYNHKEL